MPGVATAAPGKVDLCHVTGNGSYRPINVSVNALAAHLRHGDVQQPNGAVPGVPGAVLDASCAVVSWTYLVNVAPDSSAQDPASPGNLFAGTGIPAENFATATNIEKGIELGMMVLYRQGPTVPSTDTFADDVLEFDVASGPQSVANGSSANNALRAAWNYTFSVATGLGGATTDLNDFTVQLLVDMDPGAGVAYRTFTLEPGGLGGPANSGFQWRDLDSGLVVMADDEGNVNVTQNSQNYAFYGLVPPLDTSTYTVGGGFAGPATFDVVLQAFSGAQLVARNHIVVNVAP
jgi:hypothetical protein